MSASSLDRPIFVVGTHRSGTTLLAQALGRHPDTAYWEEPRHVWTWGNNYATDDRLTAEDARPRVRAHIRASFARFLGDAGGSRLVEKTPSNCLRLPFIDRIFPDARYIHIVRDGRAVVHSTLQVVGTRSPERRWYAQRLLGTPIWEWPALASRLWHTVGQRVLGRGMSYWGPRPPGWKSWLRHDSRPVILAKQWRYTLEPALAFRSEIPTERWMDVRYEDLVAMPREHAERLRRFADLEPSPIFDAHLEAACRTDRVEAWRDGLSRSDLDQMRSILEPLLDRLGYPSSR